MTHENLSDHPWNKNLNPCLTRVTPSSFQTLLHPTLRSEWIRHLPKCRSLSFNNLISIVDHDAAIAAVTPKSAGRKFSRGGLSRYFLSNMGVKSKKLAFSTRLYGQKRKIHRPGGARAPPYLSLPAPYYLIAKYHTQCTTLILHLKKVRTIRMTPVDQISLGDQQLDNLRWS